MQATVFLILIGVVFAASIIFAILIWRQSIKFEKKALAAKQRKQEYMRQLEIEQKQKLAKGSLADPEEGTSNEPADNQLNENTKQKN